MKYLYVFVLICCVVNELYSADTQQQHALVGLARILHDATPLPSVLNKEIEKYVTGHLWTSQVPTNGRCFVRRLSDKNIAAIEQNGRITVFDTQSGERKRSLRSHCKSQVEYAEALSPQHVVLALKKGVLRVVDLSATKENSSSFDIPGVPDSGCRFKGLALLSAGVIPEVVVGDNQGWNSSILVFKIDLQNQKFQTKRYGVNGYPQCITTLPDRKIRFTQCQDGFMRNVIFTLDVETGGKERMEQPNPLNPDVACSPDFWVPDRITGRNLFVFKFSPTTQNKLLRNGKDMGTVPFSHNPEILVADIPEGFVSGFDNQLLVRDDDGNITQKLLADEAIQEVRYDDGILTAVSSRDNATKISAWRVPAVDNEVKDEGS